MKQALVVWGGWAGHEPQPCAAVVERMLREDGFEVRIDNTTRAFTDPNLKNLSLVVPILTMSTIEREEIDNLSAAVQSGVGLAGFHGGMGDSFRQEVKYHFMVGGQWVAHPGNVVGYTVKVTRPDDPIMRGISDFAYTSEQYYMHVDPNNEVLATTRFTGEHCPWIEGHVIPVVWKRRHGRGRVFYCSLGHKAHEFERPEMSTIVRRGMNWAAR